MGALNAKVQSCEVSPGPSSAVTSMFQNPADQTLNH
jgi:hypothetical protein